MRSRDYEEFVESLNASGARYLIVGAHAVAFHARPRATKDFDVFIEPSPDNAERVLRNYRVVSYPTARGCAAAYYPEANVLVPLESVAEGSQTPASKAVIVKLEPVLVLEEEPTAAG